MEELKITVTKEIIQHPDGPPYPPSVSLSFAGGLTPNDQRRLIESLVSDLVRRIDDLERKL
jgi:hypothetical protein